MSALAVLAVGVAGCLRVTDRDGSVTRSIHSRVTDRKSLTLTHRQRCGESVTIGHPGSYPQVGVTGTPIGVVARAHVRARKAMNRKIGHIGHPRPSTGLPNGGRR